MIDIRSPQNYFYHVHLQTRKNILANYMTGLQQFWTINSKAEYYKLPHRRDKIAQNIFCRAHHNNTTQKTWQDSVIRH